MYRFSNFLGGGIFVLASVCALYFLRFWKDTADKFFLRFAIAFFLLGFERIPLLFLGVSDPSEMRPYVYTIRLMAFLLIMHAIYKKNREKPVRS